MLHVVQTIGPVFIVILLGWVLRWRMFIPSGLIAPLNRLVYYLAIPAMIFSEVAKSSFALYFDPLLLAATLCPLFMVFLIALVAGKCTDRHGEQICVTPRFHADLLDSVHLL